MEKIEIKSDIFSYFLALAIVCFVGIGIAGGIKYGEWKVDQWIGKVTGVSLSPSGEKVEIIGGPSEFFGNRPKIEIRHRKIWRFFRKGFIEYLENDYPPNVAATLTLQDLWVKINSEKNPFNLSASQKEQILKSLEEIRKIAIESKPDKDEAGKE